MKKSVLLCCFLFFNFNSFSQKDSIVNYFDSNGLSTTIKEKIDFVEIISKVNDTLWKRETISRTGKLLSYTHYKSKDKKYQIGESVHYHFNGKVATLSFYNNKGLLHGKEQRWFYTGSKDREGFYKNDKKQGVWKYYHINGNLAAKLIYKDDFLVNSFLFDENGNKQDNNKSFVITPYDIVEPPEFKGGHQKYIEEIQDIISESNFDIQGRVKLGYTIDVNGRIKEVTIDEKIPQKLFEEINSFMKNMKGWKAGKNSNRRVPFRFSHILVFK